MQYHTIADIRVVHEYFRGACSCFYFVATETTQNEIFRRNIIIREEMGCLKILALENSVEGLEFLRFGAFSKDMNLYGVTVLNSKQGHIPVAVVDNGSVSFADCSKDVFESEFGINKPMFCVELRIPKMGTCFKSNSVDIPLKTRCCRWQYYIQGNVDLDDMSIICLRNDDQPNFETERKSECLMVFTSAKNYPIIQGDKPRFQLRAKKSSRILLNAMPNMDYRSLSRMGSNGDGYEIVAESFINL